MGKRVKRKSPKVSTAFDDEAMIDETIAESFPASDAPGWTLGVEKHVVEEKPKRP